MVEKGEGAVGSKDAGGRGVAPARSLVNTDPVILALQADLWVAGGVKGGALPRAPVSDGPAEGLGPRRAGNQKSIAGSSGRLIGGKTIDPTEETNDADQDFAQSRAARQGLCV